jgi:hypothetical protein
MPATTSLLDRFTTEMLEMLLDLDFSSNSALISLQQRQSIYYRQQLIELGERILWEEKQAGNEKVSNWAMTYACNLVVTSYNWPCWADEDLVGLLKVHDLAIPEEISSYEDQICMLYNIVQHQIHLFSQQKDNEECVRLFENNQLLRTTLQEIAVSEGIDLAIAA